MKLIGNRLNSTELPNAGVLGAILPFLAICGVITLGFDITFGGWERPIIGFGMLAAGVLLSRWVPVWRQGSDQELELLKSAHNIGPHAPWLRMAKQFGWMRMFVTFIVVCALLMWAATLLTRHS